METKNYSTPGWLALAAAVLFPLAIIVSIISQAVLSLGIRNYRPTFDIGDVIFLIYTIIVVYVFLQFKKLLNERYNFSELNVMIMISIWWMIFIEVLSFVMSLVMLFVWPVDDIAFAVVFGSIFAISVVLIGIIDIMIAVKLFRNSDKFSDTFTVFAYVSIISGICEISIILAPLSLVLAPITMVVIGMIFLQEKREMEFV